MTEKCLPWNTLYIQLRLTWLHMLGPVIPQCMQASARPFNYAPHTSFSISIMLMSGFWDATLEQKSSHSKLGHQSRLSLCVSCCISQLSLHSSHRPPQAVNIQIMSRDSLSCVLTTPHDRTDHSPSLVQARPAHPVSHQRTALQSWTAELTAVHWGLLPSKLSAESTGGLRTDPKITRCGPSGPVTLTPHKAPSMSPCTPWEIVEG